ncbi:MAG TPA: hydroxymyristoyl-ACP dehydratase [Bacteroidales bacterium]|jgi:predicted hotdog family 3-hydroxylacyl-ACP dehydratase|nr:hydroxymyristoyl-ACP dehydratase [Bacteroidales bacterium]
MIPYNAITDLIPQRRPMQMIDRLLSVTARGAKGSLSIKEDNLFIEKGFLSESALIEFIAQTAAAYTGYNNMINKTPVKEGYIGAVKNLVVFALSPVGSEIISEIEIINEIVGFTIISGKVFLEDRLLAECEMRILAGI